ncbi:hypothetical protein GOP47_0016512, partial [Adiantum capillus-veneris]
DIFFFHDRRLPRSVRIIYFEGRLSHNLLLAGSHCLLPFLQKTVIGRSTGVSCLIILGVASEQA